jgi:hypothetical protein
MNNIFGEISRWSCATQVSSLDAKTKTTQAEQNDFQNFLNTEKPEISKATKMSKEAIELIKEVGFVEFARIARTVKQIQRALTRAMQDFPAYKKDIEAMIDSYENQMPRSVSEAFGRLDRMLTDLKLPEEVIDTIMRYIKEEMKQSSDGKAYDIKMNSMS